MKDLDVLVVGGGISGLGTAWWLARLGARVEVWEAAARPGGLIATARADGYVTDSAASMILNYRPEVSRFLADSGLERRKQLRVAPNNRYLARGGRLVRVPGRAMGLLRSDLLSPRAKLRLLLEPWIARGRDGEESVSEFVRRRLGEEILETAVEPYVGGVLAANPDHAHAASTLPRLTALEQRYGSIALGVLVNKLIRRRTATRMEAFSFGGGMATLTEALGADPRVRFCANHQVCAVTPVAQGWRVRAAVGGRAREVCCEHLVLSAPAPTAARLLAPLSAELAALLNGIEYAPITQVHLGFDRAQVPHPLDGGGALVPRREGTSLAGCLWPSSLFPDRAPPGKVLLSSILGGARDLGVARWDEGRCVDEVLRWLGTTLGVRGVPEMIRIDRHQRGLPLYHGAYGARLAAIERAMRPFDGLHLAANYLGGIAVRDRLACAHRLAQRIGQTLHRARPAASGPLPRGRPVVG